MRKMIIQNFISWAETAPDPLRSQATHALARAWITSEFSETEKQNVTAALTVLLDDPFPPVRMALAEVLAPCPDTPRHILYSLAEDVGEVASIVFRHANAFTDDELIEAIEHPAPIVQVALAQRRVLSARVCSALAKSGTREACLVLLHSHVKQLTEDAVEQIWSRHVECAEIRGALLDLPELAIHIRHDVLLKHALAVNSNLPALSDMPGETKSPSSLAEASDKIALRLSQEVGESCLLKLAEHLRATGQLNTRLLLRAACIGRFRLLATSLSLLTGLSCERVYNILASARAVAVRALLKKAGIPMRAQQIFLLVAEMVRMAEISFRKDLALAEARLLSEALLDEVQDETFAIDGDLKSFMRKFVIDTARQEARAQVRTMSQKVLTAA
ncbi:MAG: DUF2336 domain-containing protein [Rhodobacteraceae bacterium]|nr:DUF2336 domain-containing protein [Paracoccaceae bacterium]